MTLGTVLDDEQLALPTPGDLVPVGEAVAILAGKHIDPGTTAYHRHRQRLVAHAQAYTLPGRKQRRYSRAEVLALRAAFELDGVNGRPRARRRVLEALAVRVRRETGRVNSAEAAAIAGVSLTTAHSWGPRYGGVQIGGCWFYDPAVIAQLKPRAGNGGLVEVPCSRCGGTIRRKASQVHRNRETAAAAGREPVFFCSDCWNHMNVTERRAIIRQRPRGDSPRDREPNVSAALRAQWAAGKRNREAARAVMVRNFDALLRARRRFPEWVDKRTRKRWGHSISADRRAELENRARSRAQDASDRSRVVREREIRFDQLWLAGMPGPDIAADLGMTLSNVKQMRRRRGLPPRPRGRRPKK